LDREVGSLENRTISHHMLMEGDGTWKLFNTQVWKRNGSER